MEHSFDIEVAKQYGVNKAILFKHICYWYAYNKANNKNYYDGDYWTYNSYKAFTELFTYWNEKQVRYLLNEMIKDKLIKKGKYNKVKYDQTNWYSLGENGKTICQNCQINLPKLSNQSEESGKPIPNINQIKNQIKESKKESIENSYNDVIDKYIPNQELNNAMREWVKGRLFRKDKLTNYAVELACKKVLKMPTEKQLQSVEESIIRGWKGIFMIEDEKLREETRKAYIKDVESKIQKNKNNIEKTEEMFTKAHSIEFQNFLKGGNNDTNRSKELDTLDKGLLSDKKNN